MPEVVCLGEALVDLFAPDSVSIKDALQFERSPGGAPANVATALAKLGVRSGLIGKVGDDPFGHLLRDTLLTANVDIKWLTMTANARTTLAWVAKPTSQESEFLFYRNPGADSLLNIADVDRSYIENARIFHFGSVSMSVEPARTATLHAAQLSRNAGVLVSFDPNWRPLLWRSAEEGHEWIVRGLEFADVVKVNEAELSFVTDTADCATGSRWLLNRGARLVVVTRGAKGAYFATRRREGHVKGFPVEVVDTTGSGDAFVSGLLFCLLACPQTIEKCSDETLRHAVTFANAAGALAATRKGVIPALATRDEIESFLEHFGEKA